MGSYRQFDYTKLASLYHSEGSLEAAAAKAGCSRGTVYNALRADPRKRSTYPGPTSKTTPPGIPYRYKKPNGYVRWKFRYWGPDGKRRNHELSEHRVVMESILGRPLTKGEAVHHRNAVRDDNSIENLELIEGFHGAGPTVCRHCGGVL